MKHIKNYEAINTNTTPEKLKEFFKDKIDWKLVRFIDSCLVEYEDKGFLFDMKIDCVADDVYMPIYTYDDNQYTNYKYDKPFSEFIDAYNKYGNFCYQLSIKSPTTPEEDRFVLKSIKQRIENKFTVTIETNCFQMFIVTKN